MDENRLDPKILEFVKSDDFKSLKSLSSLSIDVNKSRVIYYNQDVKKPEIRLVLKDGDKIVAIIDAIKNTNKNILLPNNDEYFMLYRDLSNFDLVSLAGEIKLIDLNYDNHIINELTYSNGVNKKATSNPFPSLLLKKYSNLIGKNHDYLIERSTSLIKNQNNKGSIEKSKTSAANIDVTRVPCDLNHNGNLSFSECYMCMNGACQTNSDCYTLCYGIGDVVGWVGFGFPHCQAAIATSCIWLSIEY